MTDRNLTPWYGLANLETDAPIVTHCGKTVDPIRIPGLSGKSLEIQVQEFLAEAQRCEENQNPNGGGHRPPLQTQNER